MMPFANMSAYANGNGNCKLVALMDVTSSSDDGTPQTDTNDTDINGKSFFSPAPKLKKGETGSPVTQYWTNKKTGIDVYCIHGGVCWPAHVKINGKLIESVRVTNCKASPKPAKHESYDEPGQDLYYLIENHKKK